MTTVLYPESSPYSSGTLQVSDLHTLYYEQYGNPAGVPVVYLHGGPGSGINPLWIRYFDPSRFRIITFDQRGCGKSTPYACLEENTTWYLVDDIESLRKHLDIAKWFVAGGSWGSTLALAYSETHPNSVSALLIWGIFFGTPKEVHWIYQYGASAIFPDAWEDYVSAIPQVERKDLVKAFYKYLLSEDKLIRLNAAKAWSCWEASILKLIPDKELLKIFSVDEFAVAHARIECHYFVNKCFLSSDDQLLQGLNKIRHIPTTIIQARYDLVCPMETAWELHKQFPEATFVIVPDAGHSARDLKNAEAIVSATNQYAYTVSQL